MGAQGGVPEEEIHTFMIHTYIHDSKMRKGKGSGGRHFRRRNILCKGPEAKESMQLLVKSQRQKNEAEGEGLEECTCLQLSMSTSGSESLGCVCVHTCTLIPMSICLMYADSNNSPNAHPYMGTFCSFKMCTSFWT